MKIIKKVDLIRDYYKIKSERNFEEQKTNEPFIDKLNKIVEKLKVYDDALKFFDEEMLKFKYDINDISSFEKYKYCLDVLKKYDKFIIGENRYVYYDREANWEQYNVKPILITLEHLIILHSNLNFDNSIAIDFQEYFDNGKLIEPEQIETEEERQAYKEKLDNALKSYY